MNAMIGNSLRAAVAGAVISMLPASVAAAPKPGTDWLWLSASLNTVDCTFTITVNWAGFQDAKLLEVFATEGYAGVPILPTDFRIKNRDNQMTVTMPPLAPSTTFTMFYAWAQLIDTHGNAIPASLDFTGQQGGYCAAP
ncbi:MAG TPA: hypothetical protein VFP44_01540 [Usitatibacter sp.]|nr:hypothetical protein [Usitatibacter sp.]